MNVQKIAIEAWEGLAKQVCDFEEWLELAAEEDPEAVAQVEQASLELEKSLEKAETQSLLTGVHDQASAILTVHAGSGGTDAQDWAEMLLRMYIAWGEDNGFKVEVADRSEGDEAGIHSATIFVTGPQAYGLLQSEHGVHRLVRISPFDQARRRHTAFSRVEVTPELADEAEVEIRPEDLKVDTYRSSGAGGQHVNKTESAIRITHLPTGLVVACQNERSQHSNRATAMRILKSKLAELQVTERADKLAAIKGEHREAAWANQIRNYVMQPYTQVKDRRTGAETTNVQGVLNGDLNIFPRAWLEARRRLGREPTTSDGGAGPDDD